MFTLCDLTPSLVCVDKVTTESIQMPPDATAKIIQMPLQHNIRISVLRLLNKFQGFATSSVDFTLASLVLKQLTKAYSISSGTWLRQCIVEYQYLVKPFLTIPNRGSKGRYAWEVRREATRFFYYLDANKVSRVSLDEIHMNATMKLEQWHAYNSQSAMTRAASEYNYWMTCPEARKAHSFKCLQHDCALLAGDYRWLYKEPSKHRRPRFFSNTVAEDYSYIKITMTRATNAGGALT